MKSFVFGVIAGSFAYRGMSSLDSGETLWIAAFWFVAAALTVIAHEVSQ